LVGKHGTRFAVCTLGGKKERTWGKKLRGLTESLRHGQYRLATDLRRRAGVRGKKFRGKRKRDRV